MDASGLTYPNRFVRAYAIALQQTAGIDGIFHIAGLDGDLPPDDMQPGLDFAEIATLTLTLEELYGARGGRGMALRAGDLFFEHGLRGQGVLRGVMTPKFKALPVSARAQISLMALAAEFTKNSDQNSQLQNANDAFQFVVDPSPFAWGRVSDKPVCHVLVGVLRACLRWATDGYEFIVQETACHATGAETCTFLVNKNPIGRIQPGASLHG